MKTKRIALVLLALCLFVAAFPPIGALADTTGICFVSINDELLELSTMPSFVDGSVYLSTGVFKSLGITCNYFESDNVALLYNSSKQVFFNLNTGESYDSYGTYYPAKAAVAGGQICFPAYWTCSYFGLSFSYIQGKGYGDIARVKNGLEVLNDDMFLNAVTSLMKVKYNEYIEDSKEQDKPIETEPEGDEEKTFLAILGKPNEKQLDVLQRAKVNACFFLDEEEITNNSEMVRKLVGLGHNIGIMCSSATSQDCDSSLETLFTAAQIRPVAIAFTNEPKEEIIEYVEGTGIPVFLGQFNFVSSSGDALKLMGKIGLKEKVTAVELDEQSPYALTGIIQYLTAMGYKILPLRETSF